MATQTTGGFDMRFDEELRTIIMTFHGVVTIDVNRDSNRALLQKIEEMGVTEENPIHLIVDCSHVERLAYKVRELSESNKAMEDPRIFWAIIIVPPGFMGNIINLFATVVTQITQKRFRSFKTLDESVDFLKSPSNPFWQAQ